MARRGRRTQWLSAALLVAGGTAVAATPSPLQAPTVTATPDADTAAQADLLLYLSEFEDAHGEWVDPAELPPSSPPPEEDDDAT